MSYSEINIRLLNFHFVWLTFISWGLTNNLNNLNVKRVRFKHRIVGFGKILILSEQSLVETKVW